MENSRIPSGGSVAILGAIGASLALGGLLLDRTGVGHVFPGRATAPSVTAADLDLSPITPAEARPEPKPPIVLAADPISLIPPATLAPAATPPATPPPAATPSPAAANPPAQKVPAAVKRTPPPAHIQAQPLIPPAPVPDQLGPPPQPRGSLSIETDLLPLGAPPAASPPPKQPAS
jgi:hypothetical protein